MLLTDSVVPSPSGAPRTVSVLPIRPSPSKSSHRTNFLPILPKFRTRRLPKSRSLRRPRRRRSPTPTDAEVREKVMAILERMKEIEQKQRMEKEEAILARIGGIKRAAKATRSVSSTVRDSSTVVEAPLEIQEAPKIPRLEPISPASSVGETTSSQLAENTTTRSGFMLKAEECSRHSASPSREKSADSTPSPSADHTCFISNNLDQCLSTRSQENAPRSTGSSSMGSTGTLVRRCTCSRTGCLKLYCDCFAAGQRCLDCCCFGCRNNSKYEELRQKAIKRIVTRKPDAFLSKIEYSSENETIHTRGCNCKRSACLKNYCECYEARIRCTSRCRCQSCFNTETWTSQAPASIQPKTNARLRSMPSHASITTNLTTNSSSANNCTMMSGPMSRIDGTNNSSLVASANSPATTNGLDPLSAMLIGRADSPDSTAGQVVMVGDKQNEECLSLQMDSEERTTVSTVMSVGSPAASHTSTPPSSTPSVVQSPSFELRLGTQPTINPSQLTLPTHAVPTSTILASGTASIAPGPTQLDRIWQIVSQAAGQSGALPLSNPLTGLSLSSGGSAPSATAGLGPSPSSIPVPPVTQSTILGFPNDASNLLTNYLVALLSGQSQVPVPPQPVPNLLNPTGITSISPSAILLNCPTTPVPTAMLAAAVAAAGTTTTASASTTTSLTTALDSGTAPIGNSSAIHLRRNSVSNTLPTVTLSTLNTVSSVSNCTKKEHSALVTSTAPEVNRLNGDDQYTAEELATFERLLQQRHRTVISTPTCNPPSDHREAQIKVEQSQRTSDTKQLTTHGSDKPQKSHLSLVRRLNVEVQQLRHQVFRLTRTVRSQDRSIRMLQRTIRQIWMPDSTVHH